MIHLDVINELRAVAPESLTAGQLKGKLLATRQDRSRDEILCALRQLKDRGVVEEVNGAGEGAAEWRLR
jgi:hypothetical protein